MSQREWADKDFYRELGVKKSATAEDIKKSYRKLARELHPDANPNDSVAEERFKRVSEAHNVLSDPATRQEYDDIRSGFGARFPSGGGRSDFFAGQNPGFGDMFGSMFNQRAGGERTHGPKKGADVETNISISFAEAALGTTTKIRFTAPAQCVPCHGSGAKEGTSPKICGVCSGTGMTSHAQGGFSFSDTCRQCSGHGRTIDTPCPDCSATGVVTRERTVNIKVPHGMEDGQRIRLAGQGQAGMRGAPSGDLYVTLSVSDDPVFTRDGLTLKLTVPVSYPELISGTVVSIPTLEGRISIRVAANSRPGTVLRLKGKGITKGATTGDVHATLELAMPDSHDESTKATIDEYARQLDSVGYDPRGNWAGSV